MITFTHLATTEDIASFGANDLALYRYVALFYEGPDLASSADFGFVLTALARFLGDRCLVVSQSELERAPEGCFVRSCFRIFESRDVSVPCLGIATIVEGENDRFLLRPLYQTLYPDNFPKSRYPFFTALNECLAELGARLNTASIDNFPLPPLPSKLQATCCPNGKQIRELRQSYGSIDQVTDPDIQRGSGERWCKVTANTLMAAENYTPIANSSLGLIAQFLDLPAEQLQFERLVPRKGVFEKLRQQCGLNLEELSNHFGAVAPEFFRLMEQASSLPSLTMRFAFNGYRKVCPPKLKKSSGSGGERTGLPEALKFRDLIDIEATEQMAQD